MIGLTELVRDVVDSEIALAVRADMRRQKTGTKLMERLPVHARVCGIRRVAVMYFSEDTFMPRPALHARMHLRTEEEECNAFLELEAPMTVEVTR